MNKKIYLSIIIVSTLSSIYTSLFSMEKSSEEIEFNIKEIFPKPKPGFVERQGFNTDSQAIDSKERDSLIKAIMGTASDTITNGTFTGKNNLICWQSEKKDQTYKEILDDEEDEFIKRDARHYIHDACYIALNLKDNLGLKTDALEQLCIFLKDKDLSALTTAYYKQAKKISPGKFKTPIENELNKVLCELIVLNEFNNRKKENEVKKTFASNILEIAANRKIFLSTLVHGSAEEIATKSKLPRQPYQLLPRDCSKTADALVDTPRSSFSTDNTTINRNRTSSFGIPNTINRTTSLTRLQFNPSTNEDDNNSSNTEKSSPSKGKIKIPTLFFKKTHTPTGSPKNSPRGILPYSLSSESPVHTPSGSTTTSSYSTASNTPSSGSTPTTPTGSPRKFFNFPLRYSPKHSPKKENENSSSSSSNSSNTNLLSRSLEYKPTDTKPKQTFLTRSLEEKPMSSNTKSEPTASSAIPFKWLVAQQPKLDDLS